MSSLIARILRCLPTGKHLDVAAISARASECAADVNRKAAAFRDAIAKSCGHSAIVSLAVCRSEWLPTADWIEVTMRVSAKLGEAEPPQLAPAAADISGLREAVASFNAAFAQLSKAARRNGVSAEMASDGGMLSNAIRIA